MAGPPKPTRSVVITRSATRSSRITPHLVDSPNTEVTLRGEGAHVEPTNKELIDRARSLRKEMPQLLRSNIVTVREFLLTEVAPLALAFNNGVADANDILKSALGSDPQWAPLLTHVESSLYSAIRSKLTLFVKRYLKLDEEETALFIAKISSTEFGDNDALRRFMHEMFKVPPVQGQEEGAGPQLQGLHPTKKRRLTGRPGPNSKRS